jgi:hypothetical protein
MTLPTESWVTSVIDAPVAQLTIPGALDRTRIFDVDTQLLVRFPESDLSGEFGLTLEIDGARQWSRTIASSTPGEVESLEYHCRLVVEPGRDVRLRARATVRHGRLLSLNLSALEPAPG